MWLLSADLQTSLVNGSRRLPCFARHSARRHLQHATAARARRTSKPVVYEQMDSQSGVASACPAISLKIASSEIWGCHPHCSFARCESITIQGISNCLSTGSRATASGRKRCVHQSLSCLSDIARPTPPATCCRRCTLREGSRICASKSRARSRGCRQSRT